MWGNMPSARGGGTQHPNMFGVQPGSSQHRSRSQSQGESFVQGFRNMNMNAGQGSNRFVGTEGQQRFPGAPDTATRGPAGRFPAATATAREAPGLAGITARGGPQGTARGMGGGASQRSNAPAGVIQGGWNVSGGGGRSSMRSGGRFDDGGFGARGGSMGIGEREAEDADPAAGGFGGGSVGHGGAWPGGATGSSGLGSPGLGSMAGGAGGPQLFTTVVERARQIIGHWMHAYDIYPEMLDELPLPRQLGDPNDPHIRRPIFDARDPSHPPLTPSDVGNFDFQTTHLLSAAEADVVAITAFKRLERIAQRGCDPRRVWMMGEHQDRLFKTEDANFPEWRVVACEVGRLELLALLCYAHVPNGHRILVEPYGVDEGLVIAKYTLIKKRLIIPPDGQPLWPMACCRGRICVKDWW